ncbi:hypothetical protein GCM10007094_16850 [Pseudovibrio japonicus]|uniref:Uncharacterized protein n=1 Tax=Pseudovibrio japonicus TaxID=366534 RepID=A0ABQ3E7Z4_9HYPH|nr:hypothetical protein [Pseudovibrio japonicus]GHB28871.1 hypothetical protein GCM10007094_16850 [Pseudovibrio japonicus]
MSSALAFAPNTWAMTQTRALGPGLTQLNAPAQNTLKPISASGELKPYPAKSSLKPLKAKSKLVRLAPQSKLIRYAVKTAASETPAKPTALSQTQTAMTPYSETQQKSEELLALLNSGI